MHVYSEKTDATSSQTSDVYSFGISRMSSRGVMIQKVDDRFFSHVKIVYIVKVVNRMFLNIIKAYLLEATASIFKQISRGII